MAVAWCRRGQAEHIAAAEAKPGRAIINRGLIGAEDPQKAFHVGGIGKIWRGERGASAVGISRGGDQPGGEVIDVRCVGVDAVGRPGILPGGNNGRKFAGRYVTLALPLNAPVYLVLGIKGVTEPSVNVVAVGVARGRGIEVEGRSRRAASEIRSRIVLEQRRGGRTDSERAARCVGWNEVPWNRRRAVVEGDRDLRSNAIHGRAIDQHAIEIPGPFGIRGH